MIEFNKEQKEIINSIFGAYLINAPVGSGKTSILSERIIRVMEEGVKPEEILTLTFTNRATEEIKERLRDKIENQEDFESLLIKTFHSFCVYFIKSEINNLEVSNHFQIIDDDDQVEIVKSILSKWPKLFVENRRDIFEVLNKIQKYRLSLLEIEMGHNIPLYEISSELLSFSEKYQKRMKEENFLDFNELVLITLRALGLNKEIQERWSDKFKFIQLDEFQDTHVSEYLVIKELAKKHKNISLIGDIDQTIYGFRDSRPLFLSKLFKKHFHPVKSLSLSFNYRSSSELLKVFMSVLENMDKAETKKLEAFNKKKEANIDDIVNIFQAHNIEEEASWAVDNIKKIKKEKPSAKIVVLTRINNLIPDIATIFKKNDIPFFTLDQFSFLKSQVVKDLLAYVKILLDKNHFFSAKRVIKRSKYDIDRETLKEIKRKGSPVALKLSDFLDFGNYNFPEPFFELLKEKKNGRIIVLDVETTGVNFVEDEIIQIYAREIVNSEIGKEFHFYLKNKKPVDSSYSVHKISDEFLRKNGHSPKKVLKDLKDFIGDSIIVGHNVLFDLKMIKENSFKQGIEFNCNNYYDTLDIARRILDLPSYRLSYIAEELNFKTATHKADDDVGATIDLLFYLIEKLEKSSEDRIDLWEEFKDLFFNLSQDIHRWKEKAFELRPADFLDYLYTESGLERFYSKKDDYLKREKSLKRLKSFFQERDNKELKAESSLWNLINLSSSIKNIDFVFSKREIIPIITVHQAKGLEFDYVFLLGMNEGLFPFYRSDNMEEEKRLFYVALTRAREKIFLSYSRFKRFDQKASKSSFLNLIGF
jgi:DNA helicase II / ATP-dependent DNA helicase PcrA